MELSVALTVRICGLDSERMLVSPWAEASVELQNKGFSLSLACTQGFPETLVFLGMEMPEKHYPCFIPQILSLQCIQWVCCTHSTEEKTEAQRDRSPQAQVIRGRTGMYTSL